jgi:N6-adenosine-specific RNA methylase IME4
MSGCVRTIFDAPVGRHSQKPEVFFDLIEQVADGPYVELFARRIRPRWTCLGNEVLGADGATAPRKRVAPGGH